MPGSRSKASTPWWSFWWRTPRLASGCCLSRSTVTPAGKREWRGAHSCGARRGAGRHQGGRSGGDDDLQVRRACGRGHRGGEAHLRQEEPVISAHSLRGWRNRASASRSSAKAPLAGPGRVPSKTLIRSAIRVYPLALPKDRLRQYPEASGLYQLSCTHTTALRGFRLVPSIIIG